MLHYRYTRYAKNESDLIIPSLTCRLITQDLEIHQRLASGMYRQDWPASVRRGLNWLLRSRVSAVQKHSSLQLAAALVELAGPGWLLARGEQVPEAFLQVLAETLHVSTYR